MPRFLIEVVQLFVDTIVIWVYAWPWVMDVKLVDQRCCCFVVSQIITYNYLYRNKSKKKKKKRRTLKHFNFQIKNKKKYIWPVLSGEPNSKSANTCSPILCSSPVDSWWPQPKPFKFSDQKTNMNEWTNEIQKFKETRDVLETRIGGDRSHRSRWWLPWPSLCFVLKEVLKQ